MIFKPNPRQKLECPICKKIIRQFTQLPCEHVSCRECIAQWEEQELRNYEQQEVNELVEEE